MSSFLNFDVFILKKMEYLQIYLYQNVDIRRLIELHNKFIKNYKKCISYVIILFKE